MRTEPRKWQLITALFLFWTLLGLAFGAISYSVAAEENPAINPLPIFLMNLVKFYLWAALAPVIFLVTGEFPFEKSENFLVSFAVHLTACVLLAGIHSNIYSLVAWAFNISYFGASPSVATLFQDFLFFGNFFLGVLLYALIALVAQAYLFFVKQRKEATSNARIETELARAELAALKMQLQPHFLFNALHSISSLNLINPQKANRMIARLGEFLRLTLERSNEQTVALAEELEFLRYYLEIEQIRFSDRLTVEFDVADETQQAEVPHLILQPLVENAVKHGIAPFAGKGKIEIEARKAGEKLVLKVENSVSGKESETRIEKNSGAGTGLKNARSRLERIYGENFRFEFSEAGREAKVIVEIPFMIETDALVLS